MAQACRSAHGVIVPHQITRKSAPAAGTCQALPPHLYTGQPIEMPHRFHNLGLVRWTSLRAAANPTHQREAPLSGSEPEGANP